ncbi:hypothetical protein FH5T_08665 [Draconibacterium orientale]|uniref:Uncharacterized protein n=1 Tax=Draconibacterium orientale TaxID=1168034 RepID=A0ABM5QD75_9BACT|nr:hypothetical protein FH5T_08665 [Draconibacterium orientale]
MKIVLTEKPFSFSAKTRKSRFTGKDKAALWNTFMEIRIRQSELIILSICSEANLAALHPFGKSGVTKHQT